MILRCRATRSGPVAAALAIALCGTSIALAGACEDSVLPFDKEFRAALSADDTVALALLVKYPLRLNGPTGGLVVPSPKALQARYSEVFPKAVREAVFATPPSDLRCTPRGVMYGAGTVWLDVDDGLVRVSAINLPDEQTTETAGRRSIPEFACHTGLHRLLVVASGQDSFGLRAWRFPHSLLEKPDISVSDGTLDYEGTGPCAHRVWTFRHDNGLRYVVSEPGCAPGDEEDLGTFEIVGSNEKGSWPCH